MKALVIALALAALTGCASGRPSNVESYDQCTVHTSVPCVVTDGADYLLVTNETADEATGTGFVACTTPDGPAPCVLDIFGRGTDRRYVVIR